MKSMQCVVVALALFSSFAVLADDGTDSDLRCGTKLVSVGQAKIDVLNWCGEPTTKEGVEWIYQQDSENRTTVVRFSEDDTVERITLLDAD